MKCYKMIGNELRCFNKSEEPVQVPDLTGKVIKSNNHNDNEGITAKQIKKYFKKAVNLEIKRLSTKPVSNIKSAKPEPFEIKQKGAEFLIKRYAESHQDLVDSKGKYLVINEISYRVNLKHDETVMHRWNGTKKEIKSGWHTVISRYTQKDGNVYMAYFII